MGNGAFMAQRGGSVRGDSSGGPAAGISAACAEPSQFAPAPRSPADGVFGAARVVDAILRRRAEKLIDRLAPFLPTTGRIADIGCGTGHNAAALHHRFPALHCCEVDVADMKLIGPPPLLIRDDVIPLPDLSRDVGLMLFVLHYPPEPERLLSEARRIVSQSLIVLQSAYRGRLSRRVLACREWMQGRGAFRAARTLGVVRGSGASLDPTTSLDRPRLKQLFAETGWRITAHHPQYWPLTCVSRDLFVLEKA
jgi:SAM-dependent methyltransferase